MKVKVKIIGNPITPIGCLDNGKIYEVDEALALHFSEIGCAEILENKMVTPPPTEKKSTPVTNASLSSQADQVSQKQTSTKRNRSKRS